MSEERTRTFTLRKADELINGDRQALYGDAAEEFEKVARAWSAMFGWEVYAYQVPLAMAVLKMIRAQKSPEHHDSYIDMAGYVALASEIAIS